MIPGPKKTVTLKSRTETRVSGGGITWSTSTIGSFSAVFAPIKVSEQTRFDKETTLSTHRVMVDHSTVKAISGTTYMNEQNVLTINGTDYEIIAMQDFDGGIIGRHYEAELKLLE